MLCSIRGFPRSQIRMCPLCGVGAEHKTEVGLARYDAGYVDELVSIMESLMSSPVTLEGITVAVLSSSVLM